MKMQDFKKVLKNGSFGVVFPKAKKDENAAIELANLIDDAKAVASFFDDESENGDEVNYGVIVKLILLDDTIEEDEETDGEM